MKYFSIFLFYFFISCDSKKEKEEDKPTIDSLTVSYIENKLPRLPMSITFNYDSLGSNQIPKWFFTKYLLGKEIKQFNEKKKVNDYSGSWSFFAKDVNYIYLLNDEENGYFFVYCLKIDKRTDESKILLLTYFGGDGGFYTSTNLTQKNENSFIIDLEDGGEGYATDFKKDDIQKDADKDSIYVLDERRQLSVKIKDNFSLKVDTLKHTKRESYIHKSKSQFYGNSQ